jgi:hypothetical protein
MLVTPSPVFLKVCHYMRMGANNHARAAPGVQLLVCRCSNTLRNSKRWHGFCQYQGECVREHNLPIRAHA